jgi:hypothetical protein
LSDEVKNGLGFMVSHVYSLLNMMESKHLQRRHNIFFVDVEPLFAPSLDRIRKLDVEIIDISPNTDNNATYVISDVVGAITAEAENALPQSPIGSDSEEAFAKCDKNRNVKDGIGSQLVQLNPINEKKAAEEIMDWG